MRPYGSGLSPSGKSPILRVWAKLSKGQASFSQNIGRSACCHQRRQRTALISAHSARLYSNGSRHDQTSACRPVARHGRDDFVVSPAARRRNNGDSVAFVVFDARVLFSLPYFARGNFGHV